MLRHRHCAPGPIGAYPAFEIDLGDEQVVDPSGDRWQAADASDAELVPVAEAPGRQHVGGHRDSVIISIADEFEARA